MPQISTADVVLLELQQHPRKNDDPTFVVQYRESQIGCIRFNGSRSRLCAHSRAWSFSSSVDSTNGTFGSPHYRKTNAIELLIEHVQSTVVPTSDGDE